MHRSTPRPKRKNPLRTLLRILIIAFILLNIIAAVHAWSFTHFDDNAGARVNPDRMTNTQKAKLLLLGATLPRPVNTDLPSRDFERVTLQSNVQLSAWYIKAKKPKGTVLLFHGYQGNKSGLLPAANRFIAMGYNVLLTDFMGSGGSEGNSTTIGFDEAEEVKDCFNYIQQKGEQHIYLYGSSMGAVAIMKAIADYKLAAKGILIGCPFGTMYKTVSNRFEIMGVYKFPLAGMLTFWGGVENGFWAFGHNPEDYAKSISCPALLLWGELDNRVSGEEIDAIYANLNGPKQLKKFIHCGHSAYLDEYPEEWDEAVQGFLKEY
ncbi:alpha/beta hydrolase [Flavobacterium sp. RHBU_24]|uniref:alpha/beta hydrolase n=1 Tax=Flavobacterium sp. RHBU_24 TaxID=3391185 RepID=UPI0039848496